jgi:hypothetical protein
MPQATIKLQVAPKPAAAVRKSEEGTATPTNPSATKLEPIGEKAVSKAAIENLANEAESSAPEVPLPIALAAAALALGAFAIQIWTFFS